MDVLESIKQKLRIKPNLNKPEDIFVYVQHKIDPKPIDDGRYIEEQDGLILDYNSDEAQVDTIDNPNAPVIIDETDVQNFDINNFMDKLRENQLLKVIPLKPTENIPNKPKKKIKKRLIIAPAIEEDDPILEENAQELEQEQEQELEQIQIQEKEAPPVKQKKQHDVDKEKIGELPQHDIIIGNDGLSQRMPSTVKQTNIIASSYYMNNRKKFVSFINSIFEPYKRELDNLENTITCESME
jgi:hypothetical protein